MPDRPQAEASDAPATAPAAAGASAATTTEGNVATVTEEKPDTAAEEKQDAVDEEPEGSAATTEDNEAAKTPPEKSESPAPGAQEAQASSADDAQAAYAAAEKALEAAANALSLAKSQNPAAGAAGNGNGSSPAAPAAPAQTSVLAAGKPAKPPRSARPAWAPRRPRTPFRKLPLAQQLWIAGGFIAVIALVIAGIFTWQATTTGARVLSQIPGTSTAADPSNPNLVDYTDPETRFKLSYPKSWKTDVVAGSDVRLIAGPDANDLMSVRVDTLDSGSQAPTVSNIEPYLNAIVEGNGVKVITRQQITMDNVKGWYYVYAFADSSTKETGVHAQYFMLRGARLYSIVFQALPYTNFHSLANAYQQVANSIRFY